MILHQLKHAGYDWMNMRHIFVTHKHVDHLMGIIWMVRMICQFMNHGEYKGEACIHSHKEVLDLIRDMAPVPAADYVMVLWSCPDYNESIRRFEEYFLKERRY